MAQTRETIAVNSAAVIQGIALVTFPAASTVFTSPSYYDLSNSAYGAMFVPQAITAVVASLLGAGLGRRWGIKRLYLLGLAADLCAMLLLVGSRFVIAEQQLAYGMLLLATTSLGIGFGLTVPALNTLAAAFAPQRADRAVLMLNALLGLGTALAPVFVAIFVGLGFWWGLPLLVAVLIVGLLLFSLRLPLRAGTIEAAEPGTEAKHGLPARFWTFAAFALLYGIVETVNGNWASIYMTTHLAASTGMASLALTAFWVMVTVGRVVFAAIERRFPEQRTYHLLPFVAAAALLATALLPTGSPGLGVLAFGLAGLGCSALLPLTISFGQHELTTIGAAVAGGLVAFYQIGYGIAAFGVAPLEQLTGRGLSAVFAMAAAVALMMGLLSFVVARRDKAGAAAQPQRT